MSRFTSSILTHTVIISELVYQHLPRQELHEELQVTFIRDKFWHFTVVTMVTTVHFWFLVQCCADQLLYLALKLFSVQFNRCRFWWGAEEAYLLTRVNDSGVLLVNSGAGLVLSRAKKCASLLHQNPHLLIYNSELKQTNYTMCYSS